MKEKEDESGIDGLEQGECLQTRRTAAPVNVDRYMAYSTYEAMHYVAGMLVAPSRNKAALRRPPPHAATSVLAYQVDTTYLVLPP